MTSPIFPLEFLRLVYILVYSRTENTMNIEVGSYEAKTKLPELLRGVQAGKRYTITLRGAAVAELVPAHDSISTDPIEAVDELLAFMQARKPLGSIDIKALVNEGRS